MVTNTSQQQPKTSNLYVQPWMITMFPLHVCAYNMEPECLTMYVSVCQQRIWTEVISLMHYHKICLEKKLKRIYTSCVRNKVMQRPVWPALAVRPAR
jgi:hypothetical protein